MACGIMENPVPIRLTGYESMLCVRRLQILRREINDGLQVIEKLE